MQIQREHGGREQRTDLVINQLRGAQPFSPGVFGDRRNARDRRRLSMWSVFYGGFRPRRRAVRRENESAVPIVDWHEAHLLAVAISILVLCCVDAFLTLHLLVIGAATEANPFMAKLINTDVTVFAAVKMGLTGMGVLVLVLLARYRMFGRIKVVTTLYLSLVLYAALVIYELRLFFHVI